MAWPVRYNLIALLTLGTMINYIDRVNISVAAPDIMRETGWNETQFGFVFSAFLVGYALLQYPGGLVAGVPARCWRSLAWASLSLPH